MPDVDWINAEPGRVSNRKNDYCEDCGVLGTPLACKPNCLARTCPSCGMEWHHVGRGEGDTQ